MLRFGEGTRAMKDPVELLRMKGQDTLRVKQEIDALRITAELLEEEPPSASDETIEFRKIVNMP
jgi:hypothetical protein